MKILLLGNMGYVGPVVAQHLRERFPEARIVGHDAGFFAHALTTKTTLPEVALDEQHFGDVRELDPRLLAGTDAVVYLAAVSNDPMGNEFEAPTGAINQGAALAVARAAKAAGVSRFVFASSCSVYGFAEDGDRTEDSAVNPLTAYARSKVGAEGELAEVASDGFRVTCLRFATACGFSPRLRLDLVLNDFVATALTTGAIKILSDGTPWRPLIHVRDMARAMEWAIGREAGGAMLVVNAGSSGWNYRVRELAEAVARMLPGTRIDVNPDAPPDKRSYRVDFARFAALAPDHAPRISLEGAVTDLIEGLRGIAFADADFRKSELIRLNTLRRRIERGEIDRDLRWRAR